MTTSRPTTNTARTLTTRTLAATALAMGGCLAAGLAPRDSRCAPLGTG